MKVNIVTGTKINKLVGQMGAIKKMNQKGLIWTSPAKILRFWNISQHMKFPYYRISKWK